MKTDTLFPFNLSLTLSIAGDYNNTRTAHGLKNHETYPIQKEFDFDAFTTYLGYFEQKNAFFSKNFEAIELKICRYVKN